MYIYYTQSKLLLARKKKQSSSDLGPLALMWLSITDVVMGTTDVSLFDGQSIANDYVT